MAHLLTKRTIVLQLHVGIPHRNALSLLQVAVLFFPPLPSAEESTGSITATTTKAYYGDTPMGEHDWQVLDLTAVLAWCNHLPKRSPLSQLYHVPVPTRAVPIPSHHGAASWR